MDRVYKHFVLFATLALSLALLLQCVHQSHYIRPYGDDFKYLGRALEFGTWEAMRNERALWSGDYTNFLVYGLLAPFGARAPTLIANVFIAIGLVGFSAIVVRVLAFLGLGAHRLLAAIVIALLILVAFIYGAYTTITFYWLTGVVEYSLPAVALALCIALGAAAAKRARSRFRLSLTAIALAAAGFMVAGFSEMYLVFQAATLTILGIGAHLFARGRERRAYGVVIAAALAGTAASLALQMSSPGVQHRLSLTEYWSRPVERVHDLPALIVGVAELMPGYLTYLPAISGFKLLAAAGLAVALTLTQVAPQRPRAPKKSALLWPFIVTLVVQLAFLPYLWSHSSDSRVVFGRFSYSYMLTIGFNLAMICAGIVVIWRPKRLREVMNAPRGQLIYGTTVLLIICGLIALTEILDMVDRAHVYCQVTSFLLAVKLLIQLACGFADRSDWRAMRIGALTLVSAFLTFAVLAIILAVALRMQGFVYDYIFTAVVFPFVFTGFLWGASVGALMRHQFSGVNEATPLLRLSGLLSLLVAVAIGWNTYAAQKKITVELVKGARVWDATYQEILMLRDANPTEIEYREFRFRGRPTNRIWPVKTTVRRLRRREEIFFRHTQLNARRKPMTETRGQ